MPRDFQQSLAAVADDPAKCRRAMNKFQCLVSQMTEKKKDKKQALQVSIFFLNPEAI